MKVEAVEDIKKFKELQGEWDNLLELSNNQSIFLTWEWLYCWWIHFKGNKELFILLIKNETTNQIIGIAPFCIQKMRLFNLFPVKKIKFLGTDKVASDFLDFIIHPGLEGEVLKSIYKYLNENNHKWDIVEISDIEEESNSLRLLINDCDGKFRTLKIDAQICPYMELPKSYDSLLQSFSSNFRSGLKRKAKRIERNNEVTFLINNENGEIKENIDALFALHNDRYKSKMGARISKTSFEGDQLKKFHYEIAQSFRSRNWLKLYFLKHNKKAIACLYAFKYKNRLFYYQSGFSQDWQNWSLGNILFVYAIQDCIKEGLSEFHYLRGNEDYKSKWTKIVKKTVSFSLINNNFKAFVYYVFVQCKIKFKRIIKAILIKPIMKNKE